MRAVLGIVSVLAAAVAADYPCLVPFQACSDGSCVLDPSLCGAPCGKGEYLCPMSQSECVVGAAGYAKCKSIEGTWLDFTKPTEARLDALLNMLTVEEAAGQMTNAAPAIVRAGISAYQWLNDDEHGLRQATGTVFPSMCTMGPAFNRSLLRAVGEAEAHEARGLMNGEVSTGSRGISPRLNGIGVTAYAPMINMAWNARWGRNQESAGEDPTLVGEIAEAYVGGWQTNVSGSAGRPYSLGLACAKHYAVNNVDSLPASRTNYSARLEARTTWEYHFAAFRRLFTAADPPGHVMSSYNAITDTNASNPAIPTSALPQLLDGLLRDLWNWPGWVVSDYDAWKFIWSTHDYVPTVEDAAVVGLQAGMDQEGGGDDAVSTLPAAVAAGRVTEARVKESVRRLFRARLRLGFHDPPADNPATTIANDTSVLQSPAHLRLAREGAAQGMVLLANEGGVLPLRASDFAAGGKRLAVVGFQSQDAMSILGNYDVLPRYPPGVATILAGVAGYIGNASIVAAKGCPDVSCTNTSGFAEAEAAAGSADAVLYTLGLTFSGSDSRVEREGHDRSTLTLYPGALDLLARLRKAAGSRPVIAVLVHGGPVILDGVLGVADAVIDAHYPGMRGGDGLADVIFGAVSPAGRLSTTYYASDDAVVWPGVSDDAYDFYAGTGATYRYVKDAKAAVRLPFGFGLSYTTFQYLSADVSEASVGACGSVTVTVKVRNSGKVDSDEVVQLYVLSPPGGGPARALADFQRVHIPAGATVSVPLVVEPEDRLYVDAASRSIWKPRVMVGAGEVSLFAGGGQPGYADGVAATFAVTEAAPMASCSSAFPALP